MAKRSRSLFVIATFTAVITALLLFSSFSTVEADLNDLHPAPSPSSLVQVLRANDTPKWQYKNSIFIAPAQSNPLGQPGPAPVGGSGIFTPHPLTANVGTGNSHALVIGDINGDGFSDMVVAKRDNFAQRVWLNTGAGTFVPHPQTPQFGGENSSAIVLGDIDGDADLDVVVGNHSNQAQTVWLNDGTGRFSAHPQRPTFGAGPSTDIVLGDIDGDTDLDAVVTNDFNQPDTVWLNNGRGVFSPHPTTPNLGNEVSLAVDLGNLDNDGDLDLIVATVSGDNMIWLNNGAGQFTLHPDGAGIGRGFNAEVVLGDIDNDTDLDAILLTFRNDNEVWLNDGLGHFSAPAKTINFGPYPDSRAALGDIDNDNDLDLVIANDGNVAQTVWLNQGAGLFTAHPTTPTFGAGESRDIGLADLDGDNDLDAVVANVNSIGQTVWVNGGVSTADVTIQKTASPTTMTPGETFTYTLTYLNNGPHLAKTVYITDLLPTDFSVNTIQSSRTITPVNNSSYVWLVGDLPPNQPATITIQGSFAAHIVDAVVSNAAAISTATVDSDSDNNQSAADVTILPAPLEATEATFILNEDTALNASLPAPPRSGVTYAIDTGPTHGTLQLITNATGQFSYTPAPNYFGADTFTYHLVDGPQRSATATVRLTIQPVNDRPTFEALNPPTVDEDGGPQMITGWAAFDAGAANESEQTATYFVDNISNAALFSQLPTVDSSGTLRYQSNPNVFGQATFVLTVQDSGGTANGGVDLSSSQLFTIIINAVNDAPLAEDDQAMGDNNTPIEIAVLDNDSDPDGDSLTIIAVGSASHGTSSTNGTVVQYTANPSFIGTDIFTYTVSDGELSDTATLTVTVMGQPNQPVATTDYITTTEDSPVTASLLHNDHDPNNHPLAIIDVGVPTHGVATFNGNTVTYTPLPNYFGTDAFSYTISNGSLTSLGQVFVTVSGVNDDPVAVDDVVSVLEDVQSPLDALSNDQDVDGDSLTIIGVTIPANGFAYIQNSQIIYTPDANYNGPDALQYTLSDGLVTATATITITVQPVNDAPIAAADEATTLEDTHVTIPVLDNDRDVEGDSLSVIGVVVPTHGQVTTDGQTIQYLPNQNYNGTDILTYQVTDGTDMGTGIITITVIPVNDAPAFSSAPPLSGVEAEPYSYAAAVTDPDGGDTLAITAPALPTWLTFTPTGNGTATLAGLPTAVDVGVHPMQLLATDGQITVTQAFTITITAQNEQTPEHFRYFPLVAK